MNPLWGDIAGIITVTLLIVFIGIWFWAWRGRHRRVFDRMARLPMEDGKDEDCKREDAKANLQDDEGDRR